MQEKDRTRHKTSEYSVRAIETNVLQLEYLKVSHDYMLYLSPPLRQREQPD